MKIYSLYLAWLVACIATLGSLYFSIIRDMEPCYLCWYQRISLFPLVIVLGIATYNAFTAIIPYIFLLPTLGLFFALYQIALQETGWNLIDLCGAGPSCSEKTDIGFRVISLPILSACAFALIMLFLAIAWPTKRDH